MEMYILTRKLATYKKGAYTKLTSNNMKTSINNNSITLRNGADTLKQQSCVIYDSDTANQTVLLNSYPNLYFHYGLGVEKWDEKQRKWTCIDSTYGLYGTKDVYDNLGNEIDLLHDEVGGASILVCVDEEEMKYEFDNVEKKANEFE